MVKIIPYIIILWKSEKLNYKMRQAPSLIMHAMLPV